MGPIHGTMTSVFATSAVSLTYLFLVSTMFSIGLAVSVDQFLAALRDYKPLARVLLANIVLVPILGLLLVQIFPLSTDEKTAILLLALAPGGIQALQFTAKSDTPFAAAVMFILSIVGIVISPLLADLILPVETRVRVPYLHAMEFLLLFLLLPLLAGFTLRHRALRLADGLSKPVLLISNISFIAAVVLTMTVKSRATRSIGWAGLSAMAVLILSSMAIGWRLGGPGRGARQVSAVATSMRNAGVCLLIAATSFPGTTVEIAVVAFMAMMVPPNMIFTAYHVIRGKRLTG